MQAIARLLEKLAEAAQSGVLERDARSTDDIVTTVDVIARHIHRYVPGHARESGVAPDPEDVGP